MLSDVLQHKISITVISLQEDIFYTMPDRLSKEPVPDMYRVSYVLADKYARTTIGKPNNPYIKLREVHSEIVAARRFGVQYSFRVAGIPLV
jgi:hypothetical protein